MYRLMPSSILQRLGMRPRFDPDLEKEYLEQKYRETRAIVVLVGFASSALGFVLWSWDMAIDPSSVQRAFWMRLLLGFIVILYPLGVLAPFRRSVMPWLFCTIVLTTEGVFLYHISLLESGPVYGISGFMYWFILPVFLGLPYSIATNVICFVAIALLPNLLVPLGVSPEFELLKYNALIWPTCAISIFLTLMLDQLYRRIFLYRCAAEEMARIDVLTDIPNRRHFTESSSSLLELCRRQGSPVSVIMLDIDFFKPINDSHGHTVGDKVLCHIAGILKDSLRKSDFLGRYGGDEFAVILPQTPLGNALHVAEKIRGRIERTPARVSGKALLTVTISAGVSGVEAADERIEMGDLLQRADEAMYQAKRSGRNRVVAAAPLPTPTDEKSPEYNPTHSVP